MDDTTLRTIRYYDAHGLAMDARMAKRDYSKLIGLFCDGIPEGTVLDAGCGTGRNICEFVSRSIPVCGIEPSTTLRSQAILSGFTVYDATIQQLPLLGFSSLAGIWCAAVLHHLTMIDAYAALRHFHEMLKPKGRLFITTRLGDGSGWEKHDDSDTEERFIQLYDESELLEEIKKVGFTIQMSETEQSYWSRPLPWINLIAEK